MAENGHKKSKGRMPAAEEAPPKVEPKNWTVMLYLSGDNTLTEEMIFALKSIQSVNVPGVQVTALLDTVGALVPYDIPAQNGKPHAPEPQEPDGSLKKRREEFLVEAEEFRVRFHQNDLISSLETIVQSNASIVENFKDIVSELAPAAKSLVSEAIQTVKNEVIPKLKNGNGRKGKVKGDEEPSGLKAILMSGAARVPVDDILTAFILDSIRRFPAHHYALILSGHGSGAVGDFLTSNKQAFCLSIQGLGDALNRVAFSTELKDAKVAAHGAGTNGTLNTKWLDIIGFDSCLMSMAEVAFEVRDYARFMVGSEGFEPATGWPYDAVLKTMASANNYTPEAVASAIVAEHIGFYEDYTIGDLSVDLSAMNLGSIDGFIDKLGRLSELLNNALAGLRKDSVSAIKDAIILAHWEAQGYKDEQYIDLWDFCRLLEKRTRSIKGDTAKDITSASRRLRSAINGFDKKTERPLVYKSDYRGAAFQYSNGVSIFFPWADLKDAAGVSDLDHYGRLSFTASTHWDEFLRQYLDKTIRRGRQEDTRRKNKRRSFLNYRPWLFTGEPDGVRTPNAAPRAPNGPPRTPNAAPRTPNAAPRTPNAAPRTPNAAPRTGGGGGTTAAKISGMKNPPIEWFEEEAKDRSMKL